MQGLETIARDIPFIARQSRRTRDDVRETLGLPPRAGAKPLVVLAFGGSGVAGLNTEALGRLRDYTIATTDRRITGSDGMPATSLMYISGQQLSDCGLSFEDLVRAADVVVAKARLRHHQRGDCE